MLRQRRRSDPAAQTFVTEKLRLAASSAAQVVFGLRASERLVASTACSLLVPPVGATGAPAAAAASLALVSTAVPGATNSSSSSAAAASAVASRDGLLYLTPRVLGYSTLLAGDLRGGADITFKLRLKVDGPGGNASCLGGGWARQARTHGCGGLGRREGVVCGHRHLALGRPLSHMSLPRAVSAATLT